MLSRLLARARALAAKVPEPIRIVLEPFVGPVVAAVSTAWRILHGNLRAVLEEPLVTAGVVLAAVNEATASTTMGRVVVAVTAMLRILVTPVAKLPDPDPAP